MVFETAQFHVKTSMNDTGTLATLIVEAAISSFGRNLEKEKPVLPRG
jgi:hypothetical protein